MQAKAKQEMEERLAQQKAETEKLAKLAAEKTESHQQKEKETQF